MYLLNGPDALIKIGGSLLGDSNAARPLCTELSRLSRRFKLVVVPGGGFFADMVRNYEKKERLSDYTAHRMAILAMDQLGLILSSTIKDSKPCFTAEEVRRVAADERVAVLLPSHMIFSFDPFEPSWNVTSDSIAAYLAFLLRARTLILAKDVDGIFTKDPKGKVKGKLLERIRSNQIPRNSCVDTALPCILAETKMKCWIVNGRKQDVIRLILDGRKPKGTLIQP